MGLAAQLEAEAPHCRLCEGPSTARFSDRVLGKYNVHYWQCAHCGSMQTDPPTWLDEAYRSVHSATDTGMVARTLYMAQVTSLVLRTVGVGANTPCLDWGGGNGLFCRMMRDQGFNFLNEDKYADPFYCAGFTADRVKLNSAEVVTSFEVFEHLPNPRMELAEQLRFSPKLWIFSTQLYEGQPQSWRYFGPSLGRHMFFYSEKGLHEFGERNGLMFLRGRHLHMFARRNDNSYVQNPVTRRLVHHILRGGKLTQQAAALHFLARQRHAYVHWQADSDAIRAASQSAPQLLSP